MADQIIRMKGESHIIEIVDAGVGQRGVTSVFVTMKPKILVGCGNNPTDLMELVHLPANRILYFTDDTVLQIRSGERYRE
jgi:hypothetical protein